MDIVRENEMYDAFFLDIMDMYEDDVVPPDEKLHVVSYKIESIYNDLIALNVMLTPIDAAEFYEGLFCYFVSLHSVDNADEEFDNVSTTRLFECYRVFWELCEYVERFLYGPRCCDSCSVCMRPFCLKSQIVKFARDYIFDFEFASAHMAYLPNSLEEIKIFYSHNSSCPVCLDPEEPRQEFELTDCRHLFCARCYRFVRIAARDRGQLV